ncbi:siderophore ABC transporter substrate-binding protein [Wohlfahrtiimonas larvae]|uniref:Siderophore ABC transporter substrate-binding protein n=1 Tax=Wohlfahrtiimonas larvae TaxID=1157986 RepID=A0ABP9MF71_9GAMM|nr:siderophore ABC transporter substrate-binding protein [Wohlfahrtiimonas larvae]
MKSFKKAALASALVLLVAACGNDEPKTTAQTTQPAPTPTETAPTQNTPATQPEVAQTAPAPAEMTIKHASGETKVKMNPQRIIPFDLGSLDTLEALGVDVLGIPKANIPTYLSQYKDDKYTNFGGLKEPDFETIYKAKPDFIIISARQANVYDKLTEIAPTINYNIDLNNYMPSLEDHVLTLGKLFNKEDVAKAQLDQLKKEVSEIKAKTENMSEKALILLANDGKVSAYGPGSRFGFIHDTLGFKPADDSIAVSTHGQSISFEYVMNLDPDYIFVIDRSAVVGNSDTAAKELIENDLVKHTKAFQNGKIVYLDPNVWYLSGGGLKSTQLMIDDVQKALGQ